MKRTYLTNNDSHRHRHHHLHRYDHHQLYRSNHCHRHHRYHHLYLYLNFFLFQLDSWTEPWPGSLPRDLVQEATRNCSPKVPYSTRVYTVNARIVLITILGEDEGAYSRGFFNRGREGAYLIFARSPPDMIINIFIINHLRVSKISSLSKYPPPFE